MDFSKKNYYKSVEVVLIEVSYLSVSSKAKYKN